MFHRLVLTAASVAWARHQDILQSCRWTHLTPLSSWSLYPKSRAFLPTPARAGVGGGGAPVCVACAARGGEARRVTRLGRTRPRHGLVVGSGEGGGVLSSCGPRVHLPCAVPRGSGAVCGGAGLCPAAGVPRRRGCHGGSWRGSLLTSASLTTRTSLCCCVSDSFTVTSSWWLLAQGPSAGPHRPWRKAMMARRHRVS